MGRYISQLSPLYFTSNLQIINLQIITPSKVIANRICKAIDRDLQISHYSLESLTQNIIRRQGKKIASALLSRRLLQNAVEQTIATENIEGTATAFLATIKDLFRSGIDLARLQQNPDLRIQQVGKVAIAYQTQLRTKNCIDAAELYWQNLGDRFLQKPYLFYGYFAPTRGELRMFNAIAGEDSILVLPTDELYPQHQAIEWLVSQGWECIDRGEDKEIKNTGESIKDFNLNRQLQQCFKQLSSLPPGVSLNVYPDLEAEVRGVLTQIRMLLTKGIEAKDIVLVTRQEQLYGETLIDIAWEYSLPVRVAYEIPLEQTRMGGWLKLLLEVVRDGFPFEATARLLAHPLAKYISPQTWSSARQNHPQGLSAWRELGVDLSQLNFMQQSDSPEWLQRLQDILLDWDLLEKGKEWGREIAAYYRIQEALEVLKQSPGRITSRQPFIAEINEILTLLTIPAQPGTGGVELHDPTALLGTSYPYVFVLGCVEGMLPQAIADDPILDFYSRKQLVEQGWEIETAIDIARRETFYFYCLLGIPTTQITFSYPESLDRAPTLPSPYLTRLGLKPTSVNTLPLPSVELARQTYLRRSDLLDPSISASLLLPKITQAWRVELQRESAAIPDEYDGVIGIGIDPDSKIFSASQLTQLGQCPFKWFSARLLKLKQLPEPQSDLDPALRGSLYHRCLELSLEQIKTAKDFAQFNRQQLALAFETAEKELKLTQLPGWQAQRQEHINLIALNLASAEFLPVEREVIATETKFDTQWYGLKIQGQVDRIDRTPRGLAVIDYKTSSVTPAGVKDATGKANLDVQLAVYQDAVSEAMSEGLIAQTYPDETIDTAAYYSLTKQKTISRPQKEPAQLAAFVERVKTHLQQGDYPVAPDIDRKACRYCNFDPVCRKGDRLSRKH